jgi:hypothetical protein
MTTTARRVGHRDVEARENDAAIAEREACARHVERTAQALADKGQRLLLLSVARDLRLRPRVP